MVEITAKINLAPQVWRYTFKAPRLAAKRQAGNFLILRPKAESERVPLTIVDSDPLQGTVDIIFQVVGATTRELAQLQIGEAIHDVVGPLGHATPMERYGTVAIVGGGVGTAPLLPIARAFRQHGNRLLTILGARSREYLILEEELLQISEQLLITTDDGSKGFKGFVTQTLSALLAKETVDLVMAVGPVVMMKAVAELTRPLKIKTFVSLNPIMIDGTGMCGVCRCQVAGKSRLACVDGPEFDGHQVDFENLQRRLTMFREEEKLLREAEPRP